MDWALRIVGLVAVAVVSGFVWWFLNNEGPAGPPVGLGNGSTSPQKSTGEFEFALEIDAPIEDDSCVEHSYGQIRTFLGENRCEKLTRGIYSTTVDGRTIYTSVSVVRMPDEATAKELRILTDTDGSGNVNDLVREGEVTVEGLKTLSSGGGYDSSQDETDVIIIESDYDPAKAEGGSEAELDRACTDAIRLAAEMAETVDGGN